MRTQTHDLEVGTRRSRERRVWRGAFLASFVAHVLVLAFFPAGEVLLVAAAAGANRVDFTAAGGASEVVQLSSAPPETTVPVVPEVIVVEVLPEVFTPVPVPETVELTLPQVEETGVGSSVGTDAQDQGPSGLADGTGLGAGGGAPTGAARRIPPSPRGMIMPPTNRDLRGSEIEVWVFVNEAGRVVSDSTRLVPPTRDQRFNEQLQRDAAQWVFEPAREDGQPVADWFPYTIGLE